MKKILLTKIFIFSLMLTNAQSNKDLKNDMLDARDGKRDIFIQMNNGTFLTFEKLKIKSPPLQSEHFEGDGKKLDIKYDSVYAFQTEEYYALRIDSTPKIHIGKMPFMELFGRRIRNGKIELYYTYRKKNSIIPILLDDENNSGYFIRKGKTTNVVPLSKPKLKSFVSDKKGVLEEFDNMYKRSKPYKSATEIIDEYN